MRITPHDIRQQQFTVKMVRGYDRQEVEAFLEDVADDYEAILKESALLREQLHTQEERSRGVTEREKSLQDTLVTTQRLAEEIKAAARREGEMLLREAELKGEKLLEEARGEEGRLRAEIQSLRRLRRHLVEDLASTLERYHRMLTSDAEAEPADPE
ncbi:MAG TPA: DivIVA domain-containing protein [Methylomirabilota bacterium]|nr:DivIVA domain-containing protein [Methylomirabilota bacterium]